MCRNSQHVEKAIVVGIVGFWAGVVRFFRETLIKERSDSGIPPGCAVLGQNDRGYHPLEAGSTPGYRSLNPSGSFNQRFLNAETRRGTRRKKNLRGKTRNRRLAARRRRGDEEEENSRSLHSVRCLTFASFAPFCSNSSFPRAAYILLPPRLRLRGKIPLWLRLRRAAVICTATIENVVFPRRFSSSASSRLRASALKPPLVAAPPRWGNLRLKTHRTICSTGSEVPALNPLWFRLSRAASPRRTLPNANLQDAGSSEACFLHR
jgi:hypothetical protein